MLKRLKKFFINIFLSAVLICQFNVDCLSQKTDKIILHNGDHLTCEIKWLEYGIMKIKVDEMSSIRVEWDAIDSLWSDKEFEVHLNDGSIHEITLEEEFYNLINHNFKNVLKLVQIKSSFWDRMNGGIEIGLNYDKASEIFRLLFDIDLTHRRYKRETSLLVGNVTTIDNGEEKTRKRDVRLIQSWFANRDLSFRLFTAFEQNSELGLQSRLSAGGSIGKDFFREQSTRLFAGAGFLGNIENSTDEALEKKTNVEFVGTLEFKKFSYDFPEIDLSTNLSIYPNISDLGRVRVELDIKVKLELIDDFFIALKLYYTFDNKPIDILASKNDFGINFSLGYSF